MEQRNGCDLSNKPINLRDEICKYNLSNILFYLGDDPARLDQNVGVSGEIIK